MGWMVQGRYHKTRLTFFLLENQIKQLSSRGGRLVRLLKACVCSTRTIWKWELEDRSIRIIYEVYEMKCYRKLLTFKWIVKLRNDEIFGRKKSKFIEKHHKKKEAILILCGKVWDTRLVSHKNQRQTKTGVHKALVKRSG